MKIKISKSTGFLLLWQFLAIIFYNYAIYKQDFVAGMVGIVILLIVFNRNNAD